MTTGHTLIVLRFVGGPLDGEERVTGTAADSYRMAGGDYVARRGGGDGAIGPATYVWQPDAPPHWHDPVGV